MPYIKQEDRQKFILRSHTSTLNLLETVAEACDTPGDLNYAFTIIAKTYLFQHGENYQHYNDIIGALEGCKMELYRKFTAPYEDKKLEENGAV